MCSISSVGSAAVYTPVQAPTVAVAPASSINVGPAATVELSSESRK